MKSLFKNTTTYSRQVYDEFLYFHNKKFSFKYHITSFSISMLLIFLIMVYVQNHYYELAIIICACLTSFILYRYFHPVEEINQEYNSKKITQKQSFTFSFYDKYFKIFSKKEYSIMHYKKIYKIFETKDFFYIYLDKKHALLISKSGFSQGTPDSFKNFIKKKCIFKYNNNSGHF